MIGDHNEAIQQTALIEREQVSDELETGSNEAERRRGAAMVEYALLLVLVLLAAFLALKFFGESVVAVFDASADTVGNAPNVASGS